MGRRGICVKGLTEMKGIHKVVVGTKYLKYEFELRRNLTIIRGDSATGKNDPRGYDSYTYERWRKWTGHSEL